MARLRLPLNMNNWQRVDKRSRGYKSKKKMGDSVADEELKGEGGSKRIFGRVVYKRKLRRIATPI